MKKIIFLLVITSSLVNAQYEWTTQRIDSIQGAYPSLSYSPCGDLRIFYLNMGTSYKLYMRTRMNDQSAFSSETYVATGIYTTALHYHGCSDTIDLAGASSSTVKIYNSVNNGSTWTFIKSYSGCQNLTFPGYLPLKLTEDGDSLRLIYGYESYGLFGGNPNIYWTKGKADNWYESGKSIGIGTIRKAFERGDTITILSNRCVYQSSDNGSTYNQIGYGVTIPEQLQAADACMDNNRLYILHSYSYGVDPYSKWLTYTYSDDFGATWLSPQVVIMNPSYYINHTRLIVSGTRMLVIWTLPSSNPGTFYYKISDDSGQTWSEQDTLIDLQDNEEIETDYTATQSQLMDIAEYNGKISIVYAVHNTLTDSSKVYLKELEPQEPTNIPYERNTENNLILFPNPAASHVYAQITIKEEQNISIDILDISGRIIKSVTKQKISAGKHTFTINTENLSNGTYICQIKGIRFSIIEKLNVAK